MSTLLSLVFGLLLIFGVGYATHSAKWEIITGIAWLFIWFRTSNLKRSRFES